MNIFKSFCKPVYLLYCLTAHSETLGKALIKALDNLGIYNFTNVDASVLLVSATFALTSFLEINIF